MSNYESMYHAMAEDTALNAAEKLSEFGISVRHEDGTFKSLFEVVEELANWYFDAEKNLEKLVSIKDVTTE